VRFGDKYKFSIAVDGTNYRYVTLAKPVTISGSRMENTYRFTKKTSEWKIVRYENYEVYTELLAKLVALNTASTQAKCRIELYDDYSTFTEYSYEGYIYLSEISVNEDNGVIAFTPDEDSIYAWYDEHKGDKKDLVSTENLTLHTNTVTIDDTSVSVEYWLPLSLDCEHFKNFIEIDHSDDDDNGATIQHWNSIMSYTGDPYFENWAKDSWVVHTKNNDWTFYYCILTHDAAIGSTEPGVGAYWRTYWVKVNEYPRYENAVYHVIQQRSTYPLPGFIVGDGVFQPMFELGTSDNLYATNCPVNFYCYAGATPITGVATLSTTGNIKILAAIDYLIYGSAMTSKSDFFTGILDVGTGDYLNPVLGTESKLSNLYLSHNSFLKGINDDSTKGELTLDSLLTDLCNTFNCLWYIYNRELIIEHINFFENGGSYTSGAVIYTDLSDTGAYAVSYQIIFDLDLSYNDKEYQYTQMPPSKEIFHFNDGYDSDGEIWYGSRFAKLGDKVEHNITSYMTDLAYIFYNRVNSLDDTYCLISCDENGKIYRRNTGLRWRKNATEDVYTGLHGPPRGFENRLNISMYGKELLYPNGDLQWDNLLNDFWIHYAYFLNGRINNQASPIVFTSQKRLKKQREIIFPRLESGAFNPFGLISTHLGDGQISEYEINTDTDFIKVTLLY